MRKITCKTCGKEFETTKTHAMYCSVECRTAGMRENRIIWEARNPGYNMIYQKRRRQKQKALKTMTAQADQD